MCVFMQVLRTDPKQRHSLLTMEVLFPLDRPLFIGGGGGGVYNKEFIGPISFFIYQ